MRGQARPAEINLRRTDIVNMGIARGARLPVLVVGDIDRGGVFASFFGTVALLSPEDQELIAGFLVNKFRGDVSLLEPGLDMLHGLTGRHTYGVLPFRHGLGIDEEDGLRVSLRGTVRESVGRAAGRRGRAAGRRLRRPADVQLHRRGRPRRRAGCRGAVRGPAGGAGRRRPGGAARHPRAPCGRWSGCGSGGSRTPWRGGPPRGGRCSASAAASRCSASTSRTTSSPAGGHVDGLGLLPVRVRFAREKTLARPVGAALGERVEGYEIHHGVAEVQRRGHVPVR